MWPYLHALVHVPHAGVACSGAALMGRHGRSQPNSIPARPTYDRTAALALEASAAAS